MYPRPAAPQPFPLTRCRYLMCRALLDGASVFLAADAVFTTALAHPEWDMREERTWEEWEHER